NCDRRWMPNHDRFECQTAIDSDAILHHEQHIEELRAALARMLHMHHMMLETTHYRENITDARCIREMHEAPLQALNILARYPHEV
ncbi:hypothetical protein KX767_24935, partial [Escherichia coli]|nr:hypothetical protein [Escherichia coli]